LEAIDLRKRSTRPLPRKPWNGAANALNIAIAALLAAYGLYFNVAIGNMYQALIAGEYNAWKTSINMLCDEAEYFQTAAQRADALERAITTVDANVGTFAAMYDRDLQIVSDRTPIIDTPFEPMGYPELVRMFRATRRGDATVWFDEPGVETHRLHVYYRWVDDALIVIGVSKITVDAAIGSDIERLAIWLTVASVLAFALMVALVARGKWGERHAGMAADT